MLLGSEIVGRTHWNNPLSAAHLAIALASLSIEKPLDIVCVGTDRSTGDSLGPLIGTALTRQLESGRLPPSTRIYGTIHEPVHALNLAETIAEIEKDAEERSILAIDACLGRAKNIGYISLKRGPLQPGTGVNKKLPHVGDYHIIGVVNVAGFMEHIVLQNTRLSLVIQMAEVITQGLSHYLGQGPGEIGDEVAFGISDFI